MNTSLWSESAEKLEREFEFENFLEAVAFINKIAPMAEAMNHHPDLNLHGYRFLKITLSTHDLGCVSEKDHQLAEKIDALYS